jgi:tol-pal system protein YbgF
LPRPDLNAIRAPDRSTLTPEQQYNAAVELLRAGNYQGAEDGLKLFLDLHPDDPLASNAAYWLGESYYVRKNYAAAAAAFARNYQTYGKQVGKAPDNLLKLGMSLSALGEAEKACVSFQQIETAFNQVPTHIEQAVVRERERAGCKS